MIELRSAADLALMRRAGMIAAQVVDELKAMIAPGVATVELNRVAEAKIRSLGGRPGFLGLYGFPASVCVSINNEVVHGLPGKRTLVAGDIASVDIGVVYDGYCADTAFTAPVGEVSEQARHLLEVTERALRDAIAVCRAGGHLGDIGAAVQRRAEGAGLSVVRDYGGHGIGRRMHEEPWIANFGLPGTGVVLEAGMTLALEPMINVGGSEVRVVPEQGWQVIVTADGSLSAHFEHTVAITGRGPLVLTAKDA